MAYGMKKDNRKLHIFLGVSALAVFLLASGVLPFFGKGPAGYVPDVMLCYVCALTCFTDIKTGGIYALCLGFMADLFVTPPTNLSPLVFLGCMCLSLVCKRYFSRTGSLVMAICTLPSIIAKFLVSSVMTAITLDNVSLWQALSKLQLMNIIFDFACAIAVSFLMRLVCKKLRIRIQN